jgi:hypothetical protein
MVTIAASQNCKLAESRAAHEGSHELLETSDTLSVQESESVVDDNELRELLERLGSDGQDLLQQLGDDGQGPKPKRGYWRAIRPSVAVVLLGLGLAGTTGALFLGQILHTRPQVTTPSPVASGTETQVRLTLSEVVGSVQKPANVMDEPTPSPFTTTNSGDLEGKQPLLGDAEMASYLARGNDMLQNGDLATARLFFQRVAEAGDPRGALGMARSYDPAVLEKLPFYGLGADATAARQWYERAGEIETALKSAWLTARDR